MDYTNINRTYWNDLTLVNYKSEFYNVKDFKSDPASLNNIELEMLGDIKGKKILHLQCHFGMDTISLAKLGAEVTGVDLSTEAIGKANELKKELNVNVRFIENDIYTLPENLEEQFDIVFTSYGVLNWLPDMDKWAKVIKNFLKPGGELILVEFHPVLWMFSDDYKEIEYCYSSKEAIIENPDKSYTGDEREQTSGSILWHHGVADVTNALLKNELALTEIKEFDYSPYNCFENAIEIENKKFQIKGLEGKIPMLYALKAINKVY